MGIKWYINEIKNSIFKADCVELRYNKIAKIHGTHLEFVMRDVESIKRPYEDKEWRKKLEEWYSQVPMLFWPDLDDTDSKSFLITYCQRATRAVGGVMIYLHFIIKKIKHYLQNIVSIIMIGLWQI